MNPLSILCGCVVALACGCAPTVMTHGVPNLAVVGPDIYRGGQPTAEGWRYLASIGVTNDLKLNVGRDETGMAQTDIPISFARQIFGPTDSQIDGALAAIKPGTFIHCTHGQDRTGLVVGAYRVQQGWSKAAAYREMKENNFHPELVGLWWYFDQRISDKLQPKP